MVEKSSGRLRRIVGKLGLILFGLLFGCLVAEIALRVIGFSYPEFYQPDEARGYALRPGMEGWYRKEGAAYIRINSDGLRDQEHVRSKPARVYRIAVIGDSYPEGFPVAVEETFWSVMADRLAQCGPPDRRKIEVINFGVSGYGTAQELITLRERVWGYDPDLVMLTVTTNNDISDNVRELKKTDQVPYFVVRDDKLTLDDSFRTTRTFRWRQSLLSRFGRWMTDHSRVIQAAIQGQHGFKIWLDTRKANNAAPNAISSQVANPNGQDNALEEVGIDNLIYREPTDATWTRAWNVTERLIAEMRDEVHGHGVPFSVVTLSNGIQVFPNANGRQSFMNRLGISDLFYPDDRIKQFAQQQNIPVITLAPELQAYADQNKVYLHGFGANIGNGHWNQLGHRVAGEIIARRLCQGYGRSEFKL